MIIQNLEEAKLNDPRIVIPKLAQIYNHKNNQKNTIPSKFNFAQLLDICKGRSNIPDDEDEPFFLDYQIRIDKDDIIIGPSLDIEVYLHTILQVSQV